MRRRRLLTHLGATTLGLATLVGTTTATEDTADADVRANPVEGTLPDDDVPYTETGAIPTQQTEIPVGHYIYHTNAWVGNTEAEARHMVEHSTFYYTIDGETIAFDTWDDFTTYDPAEKALVFDYVLPPQPVGESYTITLDATSSLDFYHGLFEYLLPIHNDVTIVTDHPNAGDR